MNKSTIFLSIFAAVAGLILLNNNFRLAGGILLEGYGHDKSREEFRILLSRIRLDGNSFNLGVNEDKGPALFFKGRPDFGLFRGLEKNRILVYGIRDGKVQDQMIEEVRKHVTGTGLGCVELKFFKGVTDGEGEGDSGKKHLIRKEIICEAK